MTRHGNNLHAELPDCPSCKKWAWRTGEIQLGGGLTQASYTCMTSGCLSTALVAYCGIGLAVIFQRSPEEFESIKTPQRAFEWMNAAIKALRAAKLNDCVYSGREPPRSLVIPATLPPSPIVALYGDDCWHADGGDMAEVFAARVMQIRASR